MSKFLKWCSKYLFLCFVVFSLLFINSQSILSGNHLIDHQRYKLNTNNQISQDDANSGSDAPDTTALQLDINANTSYTGTMGSDLLNNAGEEDQFDVYHFLLTSTGNLSLAVTINKIEAGFFSSGEVIVSIEKDNDTVAVKRGIDDINPFNGIIPIPQAGDFFFIFENTNSNETEYSFEITFTAGNYEIQDDARSSGDADEITPVSINLDTIYNGTIGNGRVNTNGTLDSTDYYHITLPEQGYLYIESNFSKPDVNEELNFFVETSRKYFSTFLPIVDKGTFRDRDLPTIFNFSTPIYDQGIYQIRFDSENWYGTYGFKATFVPATLPLQNDAETGDDVARDFDNAPIITLNSSISGTVGEGLLEKSTGARDFSDFYRLGQIENGTLWLTLSFLGTTEVDQTSARVVANLWFNRPLLITILFLPITFIPEMRLAADDISSDVIGGICLNATDNYVVEVVSFDENVSYKLHFEYILGQGAECPDPPIISYSVYGTIFGLVAITIVLWFKKRR